MAKWPVRTAKHELWAQKGPKRAVFGDLAHKSFGHCPHELATFENHKWPIGRINGHFLKNLGGTAHKNFK